MTDLAELAFTGVPFVAEHYDKVTDPLANKTKQGFSKVKGMTFNQNGNQNGGRGGYRSDTESDYEYDRYGPPRRSQTERRRPRSRDDDYGGRRRGGRSDVVEERYAYSKGNGRAKSVGRDDRYGRDKRSRGPPPIQSLPHACANPTTKALAATTQIPNPPFPLRVENDANLWASAPLLLLA